MRELLPYDTFLKNKVRLAQSTGFDIEIDDINENMKPHNRLMAKWLVNGGRRALFASFGLGKTVTQLEAVRLTVTKTGGRGLIVLPLNVRHEFVRDAQTILGWKDVPKFIRRIEDAGETGIYLTNYETIRDGKMDPRHFNVASLDEASILRGLGGSKTFREFMRLFTGDAGPNGNRRGTECVQYRFVATATPSPNDYIELLAYADFLGIMDVSQAKTRFFKRDSTQADKLTLHKHKEEEFWLWVASWALFVEMPSDLTGNPQDDIGYELPPLDVRWHELPSDHSTAGVERSGQHRMFKNLAVGVQDSSREKRESLQPRINKMLELRNDDIAAHRIIWHDLESEREAIEAVLPMKKFGRWYEYRDGNRKALELYERHYSAHKYADGRERKLFAGPGYKLVLMTEKTDALFVWRKFIDDSGQQGINCAVFRNESSFLASELILEAMAIAWHRWPGERFYTYVDPKEIKSTNPGCCFKKAGWTFCGKTKGGLSIFEIMPSADILPLSGEDWAKSIFGSQDLEEREECILQFSDGRIPELAAKPVIAGSGCNFQRHCSWAIYLGIGHKFNDFIQSIHRLRRFLQTKRVRIDLIYTEAEREIRRRLELKWEQHNKQVKIMTDIIRKYGLSHAAMAQELTRKMGTERIEVKGENFTCINNDNVKELPRIASNSVGLLLTSVPFSTQYEYSPNYADFGHTENNNEFFQQMDYLTPDLLRVMMPGRIAAIHVKDRIVPGGLTGLGFQTVYPFHKHCIDHYTKHGFAYIGMKTIVTDVVRENNQTYRLGWTEQCKDGTKMGVGMPEYLLLFRKPPTDTSNAYADEPVIKKKKLFNKLTGQWENEDGYSRSRWQIDAHAFERSNGKRHLTPEEIASLEHDVIFKLFRDYSLSQVYDFEHHVALGESLEVSGKLPTSFMLLQPQSWSEEVWSDITRMLTLNGSQYAKGKEMHLCPMQFDIADRVIEQMSNEGDTVLDPFGGLMTVPFRAILKKRKAIGIELNHAYFLDGVSYCKAAESKINTPTLFDTLNEAV
jgi:hypothetical protein